MNFINKILKNNDSKGHHGFTNSQNLGRHVNPKTYNQQYIGAKTIKNSTLIQHIEEHSYAGPLVDQKINDELDVVKKSRFFSQFNTVDFALTLARRIIEGDLSNGKCDVKCQALAWCVRLISSKELTKAEKFLEIAKKWGDCTEIKIAEAFIYSLKDNISTALKVLAEINLPLSHSAALMIVSKHNGPQKAIKWLKQIGYNTLDFDSDGKFLLLSLYIKLEQWDEASELINALTDDDANKTPILNHFIAITKLISTVPQEFRNAVIEQVPFNAASFPLAADKNSLEIRKKAQKQFVIASEVARTLDNPFVAAIDEEYALWLELEDTDNFEIAKRRLESKLQDSKSALRFVRLGLSYGVRLDIGAVEHEIERQIALYGEITFDAAIARFSIALYQKRPEDSANYIEKYKQELTKFFERTFVQVIYIEMLTRAGFVENAKECLNTLLKDGLSEKEESRLRRIIAEIEGTNPIESRKEQFIRTNSLNDLISLVEELRNKGEWNQLCEYSKVLFDRTHSLGDAEILAEAFANSYDYEQLLILLKNNPSLIDQSINLKMLFCWALYYEGNLLEARSKLSKLIEQPDSWNYRLLQINLEIAIGDWNVLASIVANECQQKDKRNAQELLFIAQLAFNLDLIQQARDLIFTAVKNNSENVGVLASAYFFASKAGWENEPEVSNWLFKAVELSGENGPIKKVTLSEMINMKPDWERHESESWKLLKSGEIPMFVAAEFLHRSLIQMCLSPAIQNQTESDPRRRVIIFSYSGARQTSLLANPKNVGIDATSLLTLGFLGLLDKVLDSFDVVYIPHSTLTWLFNEKQKVAFHQPSKFRVSHQIQNLIAKGVLEKPDLNTIPNSELTTQVGEMLALLISEAETGSRFDTTQRLVVRPYPVHRIFSLMEEDADLTEHYSVMSSCQAIIDKLRKKGQITSDEAQKASIYLQLNEKPWPSQPEIADGAALYLDDLAINYFLHLGVLEKLKTAGFILIASPRAIFEANELISYENTIDKINVVIERIRTAINSRIETGKIRVGKNRKISDFEKNKESIPKHPTVELFDLLIDCDSIIVDDRFINQNIDIEASNGKAHIYTTIDILDSLLASGSIIFDEWIEYRTLLRKSGYCFIPVTYEELEQLLLTSDVIDGDVVETAELKAIRESILVVRMSTSLQLPKDILWLDNILKTFIRVLHGIWKNGEEIAHVRARSNWLLNQIDVRGWAHSFQGKYRDDIVNTGRGAYILLLLSSSLDVTNERKDEYWNWVEEMVLAQIKEQHPALYSWITEWYRNEFLLIANKELSY